MKTTAFSTVTTSASDAKTSRRSLEAELVFAALSAIKEAGGQLSRKDVFASVKNNVRLDEWASQVYEKTGYVRWESLLSFNSISCVKAGFIRKQKRIWILTQEGEDALTQGPEKLLKLANEKYAEWKSFDDLGKDIKEILVDGVAKIDEESTELAGQALQVKLEEVEAAADESLRNYIDRKNPYEFQDLVGALLRGMGYFTPYIAPKGRDGGLDLIAYKDPIGATQPRIKVQVKHRDSKATPEELRALVGLLQRADDVGLFVSTGGFTSEAQREARSSHKHVELIDAERFIALWQQFYSKMEDEDKLRLPLYTIHFLAPEE